MNNFLEIVSIFMKVYIHRKRKWWLVINLTHHIYFKLHILFGYTFVFWQIHRIAFGEYFCTYIQELYWPLVIFSCYVYVLFCHHDILLKWTGNCFSISTFWKRLYGNDLSVPLIFGKIQHWKYVDLDFFFIERFETSNSTTLMNIKLLKLSISPWV